VTFSFRTPRPLTTYTPVSGRASNITEKGRMVAQSGIITAMCNHYSCDITPVMHVISQGAISTPTISQWGL